MISTKYKLCYLLLLQLLCIYATILLNPNTLKIDLQTSPTLTPSQNKLVNKLLYVNQVISGQIFQWNKLTNFRKHEIYFAGIQSSYAYKWRSSEMGCLFCILFYNLS